MRKKFKRLVKKEVIETELNKDDLVDMIDLKKVPREERKQLLCFVKGFATAKGLNNILNI